MIRLVSWLSGRTGGCSSPPLYTPLTSATSATDATSATAATSATSATAVTSATNATAANTTSTVQCSMIMTSLRRYIYR